MIRAGALNRVLVTGAGGFIGRNLVAQLRTEGAEVLALRRSDCDFRDLAATVKVVALN